VLSVIQGGQGWLGDWGGKAQNLLRTEFKEYTWWVICWGLCGVTCGWSVGGGLICAGSFCVLTQ
jgi:hypothetical protein